MFQSSKTKTPAVHSFWEKLILGELIVLPKSAVPTNLYNINELIYYPLVFKQIIK